MMLPTTLFEILEHVEEHRQTPIIGTFIRLIRCSAVLISIYLVPLWLLLTSKGTIDLVFLGQVLLVELAIELLRIATIHTPTSLSNADVYKRQVYGIFFLLNAMESVIMSLYKC